MRTLMSLILLIAVGLFLSACSEDSEAFYTIEVAGSTSVAPLMESLSVAYHDLHPEVLVNVNGTGSSDGVKAANQGTSELGMSSRRLKTEEKGFGLDELTIAVDGIVVIVNPANPLSDLSIEDIHGIYTGAVTDWSMVGGRAGGIAVVSREPGSGTRGAFESIVGFEDQLVLGATEFDGTGAVRAEVSKNEDAIGYISLGSVDDSVKPISLGAVAASVDNVLAGSYALARPFLVLFRRDDLAEQTGSFLDWVMSAEGQKIVAGEYVPVR